MTQLGRSSSRSTVFLDRAVRVFAFDRVRLTCDTRFSAPLVGRFDDVCHIYLVLEGVMEIAGGATYTAPTGFVLSDQELERINARSRTFRTRGERVRLVQVRLAPVSVGRPIGLDRGPLPLTADVVACAEGVFAADPDHAAVPVVRLLRALAAADIIAPAIADSVVLEEPLRFQRLWATLRSLYEVHRGAVSTKLIAAVLGLSLRQICRDVGDFAREVNISNYRDSMRVVRLRLATLLLGGPDLPIKEIATVCGYGSVTAMGRAFRNANLPPPTEIAWALTHAERQAEPTTPVARARQV